MREKTGYYDRNGKAIRDGDTCKAIIWGLILVGHVEELENEWYLTHKFQSNKLADFDDIEVLKGADD